MNYLWFKPQLFSFDEIYARNLNILRLSPDKQGIQSRDNRRITNSLENNDLNSQSLVLQESLSTNNMYLFNNNIKIETDFFMKIEPSLHDFKYEIKLDKSLKTEELIEKEEAFSDNFKCKVEGSALSNSKKEIYSIILFFLETYEKITEVQLKAERAKYTYNTSLFELFDVLEEKYSASKKCRDDMIRFSIRKALAFMRDTLRVEQNLSVRQASLALIQKCFVQTGPVDNKIISQASYKDQEMENARLEFFLPHKKQSRNKTTNTNFIYEAFSSKSFEQEYVKYLSKFDEIMRRENQSKIAKFIDFVYDCLKDHTLHKIMSFKRLPWLDSWIAATKVVAYELLDSSIRQRLFIKKKKKTQPKKIKKG